MATPDELGTADKIIYWIGAICLIDVSIENELRAVWLSLAGGSSGAASNVIPERFANILSGCTSMLKDPRVFVRDRPAMMNVLAAAGDIHSQRNELVHSVYFFDGQQFAPIAMPYCRSVANRTWTPAKAKALRDRAGRVSVQVNAMARLRPVVGGPEPDPSTSPEWCLAVIRGDFTVNDNGGITVPGLSPLTPMPRPGPRPSSPPMTGGGPSRDTLAHALDQPRP
jgi:hypothetical protein